MGQTADQGTPFYPASCTILSQNAHAPLPTCFSHLRSFPCTLRHVPPPRLSLRSSHHDQPTHIPFPYPKLPLQNNVIKRSIETHISSMFIRNINRENFSMNPCTISTSFEPLRLEYWDSLEVLMLCEAYCLAFASYCGPVPFIPTSPAWNRHIVNHPLYIVNPTWVSLGCFWHHWITWFWRSTLTCPLDAATLMVIKRDITAMLSSAARTQITASTAGIFTMAAIGTPAIMTPSCVLVSSRTDFLCPITRNNILHLGLRLRENFDAKRRPRTPWTHEAYLQTHARLCTEAEEEDYPPSSTSPTL